MFKTGLVSIVIPFHNAENYALRCLKCLNNQIYKNYEAIFIDDGSTDKTAYIIKEYLNEKIKLISISKSGVSTARNVGINQAQGEYITFWDIDDVPHNDLLATFIEDVRKNHVETVISNYENVFADQKRIKVNLPWTNRIINSDEIDGVLIPRMICAFSNEEPIRGLVWRSFTRTELLKKNKISFNPNISLAEDLLFTIELYKVSKKIYIETKSIYDYMQNRTSTINKYNNKYLENNIMLHEYLINLLKKLSIYEINKERCYVNKLKIYSFCISNCVRNPNIKLSVLSEMKNIRSLLLKDKINIFHSLAPTKVKIACCLLRLKMYWLLIGIYMVKEKWRTSKYN